MDKKHTWFLEMLLSWLTPAVIITVFSGLVYVAVQQSYRMGANDPQIQISEDFASALSAGQDPHLLVPTTQSVDMARSLSPFVIVYDSNNSVVASSGLLNNSAPTPPPGVFSYVKDAGAERFTWQPQSGVRIAAVMTTYKNSSGSGFVLAGRSLREVEKREADLTLEVAAAWLTALVISLLLSALHRVRHAKE